MFKLVGTSPVYREGDDGWPEEVPGVLEETWKGEDLGEVIRVRVIDGARQASIPGVTTPTEIWSAARCWDRVAAIERLLAQWTDWGIRGPGRINDPTGEDAPWYRCKTKDIRDILDAATNRAMEAEEAAALEAAKRAA